MSGERITIVGAGLAGLTAAINLAREGREVLVMDKEKRHGGRPEFRPDGAGSPFDFESLEAYTGIDISPACKPIERTHVRIFEKRTDILHREGAQSYMVERGARSTSLDSLLLGLAEEAGVEFEWGRSIKCGADVARLPADSIIATGLDVEGFEAMGIPYVPFWGWFAKGMTEDERTLAWAYVDDFTLDYAFTTQVNGTQFSLLFQREKPLTVSQKEKYVRYVREDGVTLDGWRDLIGGAAPHRSINNPVLFKNNMIIIGTLAGVMEPMMNFGMLGAMICGKIGAVAVSDKGMAYEEFKRLTSFFRRSMMVKRIHDHLPPFARKAVWSSLQGFLGRGTAEQQNRGMGFVPGYMDF